MSLARVEPIAGEVELFAEERVTLRAQLELWSDVAKFADYIAPTEFVPKDLRNKPASVAAAMMRANELGISPLQGLAQIHVINGRPGLASELMRALVQSHGHEIWTEELTVTKVTLCGQRKGSSHVSKVTWTMDDAKRAGLSSDAWRKYPRAMLLARATGELCRLNFADVLAGMSYSVEELEEWIDDEPPSEGSPEPTSPKGATRKAARPTARAKTRKPTARPTGAPTGGPPPPPLPDEEEPPAIGPASNDAEPDELVRKRAQQIAIRANDADVDHHNVIEAVTNGAKRSAKEVNAAEASQVLDAINAIQMGELKLVDGLAGYRLEAADPADQQEFEWPGARWEQFIKEHRVTKSALLKEASRWAKENDEDAPTKLDDLRDRDALCVHLHSWVQTQ